VPVDSLITLCCDIILASENAEFGLPQVPLGIIPAYGGAVRLARYGGRGKAMEMVLLGERITAAEAYRVGLVNKVVPLSELLPLAFRLRPAPGRSAAVSSAYGEGVAQQRT
jgi:enoyl-CoA hydratase/carnithine racemase